MNPEYPVKLCPLIVPRVDLLLAWMKSQGWQVLVVDVIRTQAQQIANLAAGVSWTKKSLHLPQSQCCNLSHAIDLAPLHLTRLPHWAPASPDWQKLGKEAEALGLEWGGRWKKTPDLDHFQKVDPSSFGPLPSIDTI